MFTHVAVAASVAALVLTAAVLLSLRSLKSNVRGIHANVAAALGVAELLFLLGIHRTHNQVQGQGQGNRVSVTPPFPGKPEAEARELRSGILKSRSWVRVGRWLGLDAVVRACLGWSRGCGGGGILTPVLWPRLQLLCTVVAILLHYFFLSTFAWLLVQGLHLYRMQVEPRNVDRGAMRFYHALGWGVPAVLLGEVLPSQACDPQTLTPDYVFKPCHDPSTSVPMLPTQEEACLPLPHFFPILGNMLLWSYCFSF